ncbi:hypothetical protein D3C77_230380 [compost metagenome]
MISRLALSPRPASEIWCFFLSGRDALTEEALKSFLGYYVAKPRVFDSNGGWCFRLAKWLKSEKAKAAAGQEEAMTDWTEKGVRV